MPLVCLSVTFRPSHFAYRLLYPGNLATEGHVTFLLSLATPTWLRNDMLRFTHHPFLHPPGYGRTVTFDPTPGKAE